ncbi:MAG: TonB-dependent receptor [Caulobacteraceae bacterium]|nr:TonB-dependent receptor [Caulobacteraceae bacterium]
MNYKRLVWATSALASTMLLATAAFAQSTGTQTQESTEVEGVVVTASRGLPTIDGAIAAEQAPKSRSTVTQEFIDTQNAGQTALQNVNLVPGVNFTSSDAYGNSGGNLRLRSFDGNRVSLTWDGMPLNDTGNYAIFSNQLLDSELIERVTVNLGTTDVDSPTASATGGTINYISRNPDDEMGLTLRGSLGSDNYHRIFGMFDSGEFLGDMSAWAAGSWTNYDKFKGPGELDKKQVNARYLWDLGNGNFFSLAGHFNWNRNNFYRNLSLQQIAFYGEDYDNLSTCTRDAPTPGVADNDNSSAAGAGTYLTANDNPANPSSCTNYYGLRINPSNTGNIRSQFSWGLTDNVRLTVDPWFQWVLADGGGTTTISETDRRLRGAIVAAGVDLNGDGDILDTVRLYNPNITNTNRFGVTSSLIWDINDDHRVRLAYTYDHGNHRQTGEFGAIDASGDPLNVFGGKDKLGGRPVLTADGRDLQGRDRFSVAELQQWALEYRGQFFDDRLTLAIGVRAPIFTRELNQFCYTQVGTSTVRCTQEPIQTILPNGNVVFFGSATQYIAPFQADVEYKDVLPNFGASYRFDDHNVIYLSYAEGLSAPRTDNLYTAQRGPTPGSVVLSDVDPETTQTWDLGYRYQSGNIIGTAAIWSTKYENRVVNSFDDLLGIFVDRNVGTVELWGIDAQVGWEVTDELTLYASASNIHSELQENIPLGATSFLPTKGKELVETPEWTFSGRAFYDTEWWSLGVQGKYVGERWSTDVNDEKTDSYVVVDLDARIKFDNWGWNHSYLQLNVSNVFDEDYLGSISSQTNALSILDTDPVTPGNQTRAGTAPTYSIGAPRTFMITLRTEF